MKGIDGMTAKEYLSELAEMREDIQSKRELRQEYLDMASSTSIPMSEVRVQTSRSDNGRVERYGTLAADLIREIEQDEQNYYQHENTIIHQIHALQNIKYIKVLFKVYVQSKSIRQASKEMKMTYTYVLEQHKNALAEFEKMYADVLQKADEEM